MIPEVDTSKLGQGTRRRIAIRLLPLIFVLYVVAYIDRVNVSFANLKMSADLGFSDRVYGLGVAAFYVSYILLEIPGAIVAERWSPRKWIVRIMITWGAVTIMTGFIHNAQDFYVARFLLGAAEASFLPAMIVYLTRWFTLRDRSRAIACLFVALPAASLIGSPLAGILLGTDWWGLAGWRWLFIVEGVPAILLGLIAARYLTDGPSEANWLRTDQQQWIAGELEEELQAKRVTGRSSILRAFADSQVIKLALVYFLSITGALANLYWIPTFIKRISGASVTAVTTLLMIPAFIGVVGTLTNGWHSDKMAERHWHTAAPLLAAGVLYSAIAIFATGTTVKIACLLLGNGLFYAFYPTFWSLPTQFLSGTAAAASFGLIVSISQVGGIIGPYVIGFLNEKLHSLTPGFGLIGLLYLAAAGLVLTTRTQAPNRST